MEIAMKKKVEKYYQQFPQKEVSRLTDSAYGSIESEITKKFLLKHIKPKTYVADVGSGPGHYSTWLLGLGHYVHLIDLSEELLNLAKTNIEKEHLEQNALGFSKLDARSLTGIPDEKFDVTLLMGPLYHLHEATDRKLVIQEAVRITKSGGLIFSTIINRLCSVISMMHQAPETLTYKLEHDPKELCEIVKTGKYENIENTPNGFTDAYFSELDEIPKFYSHFNIELIETFACQGFASFIYEKAEHIKKSPKAWRLFLDLVFENATRPELLGASEHVVFIGKKRS